MMNERTVERLALYGGAFDPVHCAHLRVAGYALEQAALDRVVFIPAAQSPLKAHAPLSSDADRMQMLDLAIAGRAGLEVDSFELEKGGLSYTVDTVRHFRERYAQAELFWIVGGDQFEQLARWHRIDVLAGLVSFLVLARPGSALRAPEVAGLRYLVIDAPLMGESSSEIRQLCGQGLPVKSFVPASVEAFISARGLYRGGQ